VQSLQTSFIFLSDISTHNYQRTPAFYFKDKPYPKDFDSHALVPFSFFFAQRIIWDLTHFCVAMDGGTSLASKPLGQTPNFSRYL
jgi:hypothetical protein